MPKPRRPWTVTPHGPIEKIDDNLWALSSPVPGSIPIGTRRMIIVKRSTGDLLFYNAVPMDEPTLAAIKAWGRPAILVVTHDQHCIDAHGFREKLGLAAYGPKACDAKVRERVELAGNIEDVPPDPTTRFETLEGVKSGEPVMFVTSGGGVSLVYSDVFQNNNKASIPFMFRLMGFVGPRTPPLFKMLFVKDKAALRAQLTKWAQTPNLKRLVPTHGELVEHDAAALLRTVAEGL
jgi:hypothetical protein